METSSYRCILILTLGAIGASTDLSYTDSTVQYDGVPIKLLYGESHGISWTDLEVPDRLPPVLTQMYMDIFGLDYHFKNRCLFYSGWGHIWRLPINETGASGPAEVVVEHADGATSVAVDWVKDRFYWASPTTHTVWQAHLSGRYRGVVLEHTGNLTRHNNIELDPYRRFLFLAVDGDHIIRSDLDGQGFKKIQVEGHTNKRVVSLAVDIHRHRLYLNSRRDYVPYLFSCGYDGRGVQEYELTDEWWSSFGSIGVFGNMVFWTHQGRTPRDTVWKANISQNGSLTWTVEYTARGTILDPETKIWSVKIYHPDVQTPIDEEGVKEEVTSLTLRSTVSSSTLSTASKTFLTFIWLFYINSIILILSRKWK